MTVGCCESLGIIEIIGIIMHACTVFFWHPIFAKGEFSHLHHQVVGEGRKPSGPESAN